MTEGCKIGIDSWADTFCAGRHCHVEEFIMGKSVTASGFCSSIGSLNNLPLANVVYIYDKDNGTTILLECNNDIYMGENLDDALANPIQAEENDVQIDIRPRSFYPNQESAQTIEFSDGTTINILYDGVLPYIPVRRPTPDELDACHRLSLTSCFAWDPFALRGSFCSVKGNNIDSNILYIHHNLVDTDPITANLMSLMLPDVIETQTLIEAPGDDEIGEERENSISALQSQQKDSITPEEMCSKPYWSCYCQEDSFSNHP